MKTIQLILFLVSFSYSITIPANCHYYAGTFTPGAGDGVEFSIDFINRQPAPTVDEFAAEFYASVLGDFLVWFRTEYPDYNIRSYEYYSHNSVYPLVRVAGYANNHETNDSIFCFCTSIDTLKYSRLLYNYFERCNPRTIENTECFELGREDPLRPQLPGFPKANGKWVRVRYIYSDGSDSTFETVLSNGCSGIIVDGDTLERMNAHDDSALVDGAQLPQCLYNGNVYSGTCAENGLDTSCGGQLPFPVPNVDSIINPCASRESQPDRRPDDSLSNQSDTGVTGSEYTEGINRVSSDIRQEHAADREVMKEQLDEQKKGNGILGQIASTLSTISGKISQIINKIGGGSSDSVDQSELDGVQNTGYFDSSGIGNIDTGTFILGDSLTLYNQLRSLRSDTLDTLVSVDTSGVGGIFAPFIIDVFNGDCECEDDWFSASEFPFVGTISLDICPYNINSITKPLFKLVAVFILFVFYRNFIFSLIMKAFE